jgi:pimeloyl-ACP methyl ester carboxylesterase
LIYFLIGIAVFLNSSFSQAHSLLEFYQEPLSDVSQFNYANGHYVKLPNGNVLFARYTPARDSSKATIMLMNGLPDTLNDWRKKVPLLIEKGYGVLTFDFRGQGHTLAYNSPQLGDLSWQAQVEDVKQLIDFFKIPKVVVSGLSYGGGIALAFAATHPSRVQKVIAFAPFVEPVQPTEDALDKKVQEIVKLFPDTDPVQLFEKLFRFVVYTSYPLAEPSVLAHPLKPEAITRLALGIRSLDLSKMIHRLPKRSLNLVGGSFDSSVPLEVIERLWHLTPESIRQSYTTLDTGHRITTWRSDFAAQLIEAIVQDTVYESQNRLHLVTERGLEFKKVLLQDESQIKTCTHIFL